MEPSITVFGEDMLLWTCVLRQSPKRHPGDYVHRQANALLDELMGPKAAHGLDAQSVDDGIFALAALLDEVALSLSDLRPVWVANPLRATRWKADDAGGDFFQRLERVRKGPTSVLATYVAVLGLGFKGRLGADREAIAALRRELAVELGVDPARDWTGYVLTPLRSDVGAADIAVKEPWYREIAFGRRLAMATLITGALALLGVLFVGLR